MIAAVVLGILGKGTLDRLRDLVEGTPVVPPGEVTPGPLAVEGVAREHRETVPAPASGDACLLVRYTRRRAGDAGSGGSGGAPVEERTEGVPFVLEDDTGTVLVDPREAIDGDGDADYVLFSARNTDRYVGDKDPSTATDPDEDRASASMAAGPDDDADPSTATDPDDESVDPSMAADPDDGAEGSEWLHVESAIRPGDRVYVLGEAAETPGGSPAHVVGPGEGGAFLVSDLSRGSVREQLERESGSFGPGSWRFAALGLVAALVAVTVILIVLAVAVAFVF